MTPDELRTLLVQSPFHRMFDLSIPSIDMRSGELVLELAFSSALTRDEEGGQYHGGVIATLIDIAGDFSLIALLGQGVPTIDLRVDYLRPAARSNLRAHARVRKAGRTIAVVDIDVKDEAERLIAIGRGCYGSKLG